MNNCFSFLRRHKKGLVVTVVVVAIVAGAAMRVLPSSGDEMRQSAVVVERRSCWEITAGSKAQLWLATADSDTTLHNISASQRDAESVTLAGGCWMNRWPAVPSCRGRVVTVLPHVTQANIVKPSWTSQQVRGLLEKAQRDINDSLQWAHSEDSELQYYLRVHGVQDMGYQQIAAVAIKVKAKVKELEQTKAAIDSLLANTALPLGLRHKTTFTVHYRNGEGKNATAQCRLVNTDKRHRMALLQTLDETTPDGVKAQYLLPWNTTNHRLIAVGFGGIGIEQMASAAAKPQLINGRRKRARHNFPRVLVTDGCPLFTPRGLFAGIAEGQNVEGRGNVSLLMMKGGWQ